VKTKPQWPIDGKKGKEWKITSDFGYRVHPIERHKKHHNGQDIWGPKPKIWVEAWHDGTVIAAGTSKLKNADGSLGGVGWYVDIRSKVNGEWYVARYAHMVENSLNVVKGEKVKAGTRLGIMGNTGASAGRHLHFEICKGRVHRWTLDGKGFVNPLKFVRAAIEKWEIDSEVNLATPDTGEVAPAPVHEPVPVVKAPKPPQVKPKSAK
jgi:murein DD-endopeptidase MepM/ murein hydrolase activator NlpD